MKKTFFLMLALAAFMANCDKNEKEDDDVKTVIASTDYSGTLTVDASGGKFDNENIKVSYSTTEKADSASITLYQVRFSPRMPLTIDVTVPGIIVRKTEKGVALSCPRVVPLAMGGEYPNYTVTGFVGEIAGDEITFSLNFGSTPTSYHGKAIVQ